MFDGPVLGIDPGLSRCGYGAIVRDGAALRAVAAGVIRTDAKTELPQRLAQMADDDRQLAVVKAANFVDLFDQSAVSLRQPRVERMRLVQVFDVGEDSEQPYFAMEFIDGLSLRDAARRYWAIGRGVPMDIAAHVVAAAARGLAHAHAAKAADGTNPPSDLNGDADYRKHLATVLTRRAVLKAAGV